MTPIPRKPRKTNSLTTPLLGDTDGTTTTTGGLGVLSTDTETPVVTETTVGSDLLQALEILTELGVDGVGDDLGVLSVDDVLLSVEEPGGDLVLGGVLLWWEKVLAETETFLLVLVVGWVATNEDGDDTLKLLRGELTGTRKVLLDPYFILPSFLSIDRGSRTAWRGRHRPS